jgi:hypothetical protein
MPVFHGIADLSVVLWDNKMLIIGTLFMLAALFFIRLFQTSSGFDFFIKFNFRARGEKLEPRTRKTKQLVPLANKQKKNQEYDLSPIDDLDIEEFARHASQYFNNPGRFNDFLTGWWHRKQLDKNVETVEKLNSLLIKMREASTSARELQEEIIKNRVIFKHQAEIALERLQDDWETEKVARQLERLRIETEKRRQEMMANFYSGLDLSSLSESSLMTLATLNPKESTKQFQSGDSMVFSKESFTDPANLANIGFQKRMSEALYQEIMINLDLKKAETEIKRGQARQEHSQADLDSETVKANIIKLKEKFNAPAGDKPGS